MEHYALGRDLLGRNGRLDGVSHNLGLMNKYAWFLGLVVFHMGEKCKKHGALLFMRHEDIK